jgi:glycosyltransferase involved in cell wall biosynthesis
MGMKKLIIIGPVSEMSENIFLLKLAHSIKNMSLSIEFWGWERNPSSSRSRESQDNISTRILLRGGGEANRKLILWYPLWMIKIFLATFFYKEDANYLCFNFDSAIPVATVSIFKNRCFLLANRDNLSKSYNWPSWIKSKLEHLEKFSARRAKIHLIPGQSRWSDKDTNIRVVRNTPSFDTVTKAKQIAEERDYQRGEKFTVYVNGWLAQSRGIATLLKAVEACQADINVLVAGVPNCDEAKELIRLENVEFLGRISNEEALALYYKSHLSFTFYDPRIEINRFAEPNKWGDSIVSATPFVTNSGINTADEFIKRKACFVVDYDNWMGLAKLFNQLNADRKAWKKVQNNLKLFEVLCWDKAMQKIIEEFCGNDS